MQEIACIEVQFADGSRCWVDERDYRSNPNLGTFVVRSYQRPEPIIKPGITPVERLITFEEIRAWRNRHPKSFYDRFMR